MKYQLYFQAYIDQNKNVKVPGDKGYKNYDFMFWIQDKHTEFRKDVLKIKRHEGYFGYTKLFSEWLISNSEKNNTQLTLF